MSENQDFNIPVAYCDICDADVPVAVLEIPVDEEGKDTRLVSIVYCPICQSSLNTNREVKLTYYPATEIGKLTGWRVKRADE